MIAPTYTIPKLPIIDTAEPLKVARFLLQDEFHDANGNVVLRCHRKKWWLFSDCRYEPLTNDALKARVYTCSFQAGDGNISNDCRRRVRGT